MPTDPKPGPSALLLRNPRFAWRVAGTGLVLGFVALLLHKPIMSLDLEAIVLAVQEVHPVAWGLAALATAASFVAIGQYDVVVHRHLGTGLPDPQAGRSGMAAIAIGQVLGLGLLTGTVVRWRMLPGQDLRQASVVTGHVTALFLAGWAVVTALSVLLSEIPRFHWAALAFLALAAGGIGVTGLHPRLHREGFRVPNLITWAALIPLAALDLGMACLALWGFAPEGLTFLQLFPAFLIALGAGLVLSTPGGIGVFEATLISFLPGSDPEGMIAAVVAWRVVYHAIPAALAGVAALFLPGGAVSIAPERPLALAAVLARAETGLVHQGQHRVIPLGPDNACLAGRTPHHLIGLFDPFAASPSAFPALEQAALAEARRPASYKCSARVAFAARVAGWRTLRVAREAVLAPSAFSLATPERAGLRRKLRKAAQAGITVQSLAHPLPLTNLARIAQVWAKRHGGERGFSMGRFSPRLLRHQRIFVATHQGRAVAFASFHANAREWTLDLMRYEAGVPDGTMQTLVMAALDEARRCGIARLSLAAVAESAFWTSDRALVRWLNRLARTGGLLQFKAGFAPSWQPLYLCAPNRAGLVLAALAIARAVRFPAPLPTHLDEYRIARGAEPWQCEGQTVQTDPGLP